MTSVVSLAVPSPVGLPAMWNYWSGTIGDLLLLPVMIFGLVRGVVLLGNEHATKVSAWSLAAGALGALAGVASQAAWLLDPNPRQNWMLVEAHRFSAIGWYHAAFLVAACGLLAGTTFEFLRRARVLNRQASFHTSERSHDIGGLRFRLAGVVGGNGASIVMASGVLFAFTVAADSYPSRETSSSIATLAAVLLVPVLVVGLASAMLGAAVRFLLGPIVVAALAVTSVLAFVHLAQTAVPMTAVAALGAGLAGVALGTNLDADRAASLHRSAFTLWPVVGVFVVIGSAYLSTAMGEDLLIFLAVAWLLVLVAVNILDRWRDAEGGLSPRWAYLVTAFIVLTAALGPTLLQQQVLPVAAISFAGLCSVALGRTASKRIFDAWEPMRRAERTLDPDHPGAAGPGLRPATRRAWLIATTTGLGAFLALAPLVYQGVGEHLKFGKVSPPAAVWVVAAAAFFVSLVLGLPALAAMFRHPQRFSKDDPPQRSKAGAPTQLSAFMALIVLLATTAGFAIQTGWHGTISVLVVTVAVIYTVDCFENTLVDSSVMCMRWPSAVDFVIAAVTACTSGLALYWALLSGADSGGTRLHESVLLFLTAAALKALAAFIGGGLIYARGKRYFATIQPVWWCVGQNEVARTLIALVVVWVPVFVLTHSDSTGSRLWSETAVATFAIVTLALWVGIWSGGRLIQHSYEQRQTRFGGQFRLVRQPNFVI